MYKYILKFDISNVIGTVFHIFRAFFILTKILYSLKKKRKKYVLYTFFNLNLIQNLIKKTVCIQLSKTIITEKRVYSVCEESSN
jgi:hypothetical protein